MLGVSYQRASQAVIPLEALKLLARPPGAGERLALTDWALTFLARWTARIGLGEQLLDGPEPLREVTRQAVQPWDHDDAGLELSPELLPFRAAHVPARSDVGEDPVVSEAVAGEDTALGGQPARALRLGDPDVAEDCGVHVATSPRGNQTSKLKPRWDVHLWDDEDWLT